MGLTFPSSFVVAEAREAVVTRVSSNVHQRNTNNVYDRHSCDWRQSVHISAVYPCAYHTADFCGRNWTTTETNDING